MSNQSGRIQAWAELAGINPEGYNQTFLKFCDSQGYAAGSFNERMTTYLQDINASSEASLPSLEAATAELLGVYSWNSVGYSILGLSGSPRVDAGGPYVADVGVITSLDSASVTAGDYPIASTLWVVESGPAGTPGAFGDVAVVNTTFTSGESGVYTLKLTATDTQSDMGSDTAKYSDDPPVVAGVYFRPQRLSGDGVYADFVPNG